MAGDSRPSSERLAERPARPGGIGRRGPVPGSKPPDGMSKEGAAFWRSIVPVLIQSGEYQERFRLTIVEACENYALLVQARKDVQRDGLENVTAANVMLRASAAHRDFCKAFGLTPAALRALKDKNDVVELEPPPSAEDTEDAALAAKYD